MALTGDGSRGGVDAALAVAREAVALDPNDLSPHLALVDVSAALGRPEDTLAALVGVFRLSGAESYQTMAAQLSARATDLASARASLQEAVALRDTAILRVALGRVQLRQGDRAAALANALRALQIRPGDISAQALAREAGG